MIAVTIILIVVFIAYIALTAIVTIPQKTTLFKIAYAVTFITPPMSHLWHILYGEDRIRCQQENDTSFGWIPCFTPTWNNFVNTYEITLVVENIFFCILTFYVLNQLGASNIATALNAMLLVLTIVLMFGSPTFLDQFTNTFDVIGFVLSMLLLINIEFEMHSKRLRYTQILN